MKYLGRGTLALALAAVLLGADTAWAAEDAKALAKSVGDIRIALDTVWVMVAGFLVFFMHAGFAMLEAGLLDRYSARLMARRGKRRGE